MLERITGSSTVSIAVYCSVIVTNSRSLEGNTHLKDESGRLHTPYCSSLNYLQKERSWGCGESVGGTGASGGMWALCANPFLPSFKEWCG